MSGPAPLYISKGNVGGEDRSLPAQGPQSGEEKPEVFAWTKDSENTSPGHRDFSLRGEVSTCWCVRGVTSENQSGFTQSLLLRGAG